MTSNSEIEQLWIDAWNDLYEIAGDRWNIRCLLPDGNVVNLEECKGWLQDAVYQGWRVKVETGWVLWASRGLSLHSSLISRRQGAL